MSLQANGMVRRIHGSHPFAFGASPAAIQIRSRRISVRPIHGAHPCALRAEGPALRLSRFVPDEFVERERVLLHRQIRKTPLAGRVSYLAEREGFEPSIELLTLYSLSRGAPSATRASLQICYLQFAPNRVHRLRPCTRAQRSAGARRIASAAVRVKLNLRCSFPESPEAVPRQATTRV